ncbi:MAG TPA: hypothetical protein PKO27_17035 [Deltaproteobacteria bacterium]|nr:hypothetical protein [Deltaproteobacteria bacterium]
MAILVRDYHPDESSRIRRLLFEHGFTHLTDDIIFSWQFHELGEPVIKVAVDTSSNEIIGHYGLMPFPFVLNRRVYAGGKMEGSVVHEDYRSHTISRMHPELHGVRIFPLLISEMGKTIKERGLDLVFGFPNEMASKSQLSYFRDFSFHASNFIKILDYRNILKNRFSIHNPFLLSLASSLLGLYLDRRQPMKTNNPGMELREDIPSEPSALLGDFLEKVHIISADRNPRFLSWRYMDNPAKAYRSICARDATGHPVGCLVYSLRTQGADTHAEISDIQCDLEDEGVLTRLLSRVIQALTEEKVISVSFFMNRSRKLKTLRSAFRHLGFVERKVRQNAFLYISDHLRSQADFIYDTNNWYITSLFKQY